MYRAEQSQRGRWNCESTFEKPLTSGWTLRKLAHEQVDAPIGKGCYWDEHELITPTGNTLSKPDWEWADSHQDSLVYAELGGLYRAEVTDSTITSTQLLRDFNADEFAEVVAPY
ncbi:MAG: hypothetical protein AAF513_09130 [Pseudomonadota bacterium]